MKARRYKVNWPMQIAAMLLCLVLATTSMLSGLFAKYAFNATASDSARVAKYILDVNSPEGSSFSLRLDELKKPGDEMDIILYVQNSDTNGICEVMQEYAVKYTATDNLPLEYTFSGRLDVRGKTQPGSLYGDGQMGRFPAGESAVHQYTLTVHWPEAEKDPQYAWEIDYITITVDARQIAGA